MRRTAAWMLPFTLACSFDSTWEESEGLSNGGSGAPTTVTPGTGTGTSAGPGSTGDEASDSDATVGGSAAVDASSGDTSTGPVLTTEPDDTTTTTDATTTDAMTTPPDPTTMTTMPPMTTEPETTTMPDPPGPCAEPNVQLELLVEDATVTFPMVELESGSGEGFYATSAVAELGWLEFSITVPCDDDYQVWGRVYDAEDGPNTNDPDTFYANLDGGSEILWGYGCQTTGFNDGWTWQKMISTPGGSCANLGDTWTLPLVSGSHTIEFRNREGQDGDGNRAAIAKIWVTNNPNFIPP